MSTNRILKITGNGEVQFFETAVNYVAVKAPAVVPASINITLPATLPGAGQTLPVVVDDAGLMSYGGALGASVSLPLLGGTMQGAIDMGGFALTNLPAGVGNSAARQTELDATQAEVDALEIVVAAIDVTPTLQDAYGFGEDVTLTAGRTITFTQPFDEEILVLDKTGTGTGIPLFITNAGTSPSLKFIQSGIGPGAYFRQLTNEKVILISKEGLGAGHAVEISNQGTDTGLNIAQIGNGIGIKINKTGTGAGVGVDIQDVGTGHSLLITKTNGTGGRSISVDHNAPSIAAVITQIANDRGLYVTKTGTGAGNAAEVADAGTGIGLLVNKTNVGAFVAVQIANAGTGLTIATDSGGTMGTTGAKLTKAGVFTNGTCFEETKQDIQAITDEGSWLDNLDKLQLVRWVGKGIPQDGAFLSPLQDELVTYFGFSPDRGVAGSEVGSVALVCLRALHERFKAAVLRIDALEGKA